MVKNDMPGKEYDMDNLEKVEKLRKKADISYEEAKEILEKCDWDILDAVIELEARGKINTDDESSYTTEGCRQHEAPQSPKQVAESYQNYDNQKKNNKGFFKSLWDGIVFLLKKGCENTFTVHKDNRCIMNIPVLLLVLLIICSFTLVLLIMLIGLFCGYRYSFSGPDLGNEKVNGAMGKASDAAENIKEEFCSDAAYPKSSADNNNDVNENTSETKQ